MAIGQGIPFEGIPFEALINRPGPLLKFADALQKAVDMRLADLALAASQKLRKPELGLKTAKEKTSSRVSNKMS
jgi:hypothetical protein